MWNIPIYNSIKEYIQTNPVSFHMPGHKMGKGIPPELLERIAQLDLTEIPGTDNLHSPSGAIKEAQELAARAFGADKTYFLVNGSTCGIQAMIMTICRPGDKLIVARDCHKSVISGIMFAGAQPIYIKPLFDSSFGIPTVTSVSCVKKAIEENPDAVGVLITRPGYYGTCSDIQQLADIIHSYGKILAVDEAHGAHLKFCSRLPVCAMDAGADICVQSTHKTLPAFTQGAMLHVRSGLIDMDKLEFNLNMLQTSSPSYIIMSYLDIAREIMEYQGESLLEGLLENIKWFKSLTGRPGNILFLTGSDIREGEIDDTRIVVNMRALGVTGFQAEKMLRQKHNIQVEMSDFHNIVCIATVADRKEDFEKLHLALAELTLDFREIPPLTDTHVKDLGIPLQSLEIKDVMRAEGIKIPLESAVGRTSKTMLTPYPPGIPLICPGEIISKEVVEYIYDIVKSGGTVNGMRMNFEVSVVK